MGQIKAVSWSRQFPHIRQPNMGPLIHLSVFLKTRFPKGSFLKGKKGGCHLLPGVNSDIVVNFFEKKIS
jgi:hypothetical protein